MVLCFRLWNVVLSAYIYRYLLNSMLMSIYGRLSSRSRYQWRLDGFTCCFLFRVFNWSNWIGSNTVEYLPQQGFAAMLCSPIYGRITDHYQMSRYVVLVAAIFSLGGHLTLLSWRSEYGILLGKIGIGFGMSCDGSILGQVGRRTLPERRSRTFAMCFAMRQLGLIAFPALMLLFEWVLDLLHFLNNIILAHIPGQVRFKLVRLKLTSSSCPPCSWSPCGYQSARLCIAFTTTKRWRWQVAMWRRVRSAIVMCSSFIFASFDTTYSTRWVPNYVQTRVKFKSTTVRHYRPVCISNWCADSFNMWNNNRSNHQVLPQLGPKRTRPTLGRLRADLGERVCVVEVGDAAMWRVLLVVHCRLYDWPRHCRFIRLAFCCRSWVGF